MSYGALRDRCAEVVLHLNNLLKDRESGCLVQVWLPELLGGTETVLQTQSLPYSIVGVGDLLALFRCISCRYHFTTDILKPSLLGAVGRVFTTLQPEMCCDLQTYQHQIFLRVKEAQKCCVHSALLLPLFGSPRRDQALGVLEIIHSSQNICFSELLEQVTEAMERVKLYGTEVSSRALEIGLRSWPLGADTSFDHLTASDQNHPKTYAENMSTFNKACHEHHRSSNPENMSFLGQSQEIKTESTMNGSIEEVFVVKLNPSPTLDVPSSLPRTDMQIPSIVGFAPAQTFEQGTEMNDPKIPKTRQADTNNLLPDAPPNPTAELDLDPEKLKILMDLFAGQRRNRKGQKRVQMGSGKNLSFADLKAHFGYGLKEAAARLGICPTTLKRACRRNGITRWPCRQITKLNKAMTEIGASGKDPKTVLNSAIASKLKSSIEPDGTDQRSVDAVDIKDVQSLDGHGQVQMLSPISIAPKGFSSAPGRIELLADADAEDCYCSNESDLLQQADRSITESTFTSIPHMEPGNVISVHQRALSVPDFQCLYDGMDVEDIQPFSLEAIKEDHWLSSPGGDLLVESDKSPNSLSFSREYFGDNLDLHKMEFHEAFPDL